MDKILAAAKLIATARRSRAPLAALPAGTVPAESDRGRVPNRPVVDHLERNAHDELVGTLDPAAQDHRVTVVGGPPCRRAGRGGIGRLGAVIVAQLVREAVGQRAAVRAVGLRCRHADDREGRLRDRALPKRGKHQDSDDGADRDDDRRDEQSPRWAVAGLVIHMQNSRAAPHWRWDRSACA